MTLNTYQADDKRIALQAADWLMRLRDGDPQDKAAFSAWLLESRRHVRNFLLMMAMEQELGKLDPERRHDVDALLVQAQASPVPHPATSRLPLQQNVRSNQRRRTRAWWLTIASVAAALVLAVTLSWQLLAPVGEYSTATGEQRSVKLPDGSLVHLNTRSRLALDFSASRRDVRLLDGEALFIVQHDSSRPFRVITDTAVTQAVGTQFNVYKHENSTTVSVVEGRVQITRGAEAGTDPNVRVSPTPLSAGEAATAYRNGSIETKEVADPAAAVAWRERRLAFQDDSLATIVAEFNRYNTLQIKLDDSELQRRTFTGVLDADKPESLLRLLSKESDLILSQQGNEMVIRLRR